MVILETKEELFSSLNRGIEKIVESINSEPVQDDFPDSLNRTVILRPHDKPDPDAISSSIALSKELKKYDIDSVILFHRESPFYENKALHNILDLKTNSKIVRYGTLLKALGQTELERVLSSNKHLILIDTSSISQSSPDFKFLNPSIVVDHHNGNKVSYKNALKINPETGANISFLLSYLMRDGFELDSQSTQALRISAYVGIETDTSGFLPELMSDLDYEMKEMLEAHQTDEDKILIERIKSPEIDRDVKRLYGRALLNHDFLDDKIAIYSVPNIMKDSAAVPYMTDRFFKEDKLAKAVIVYGVVDSLEDDIRYLELVASGRSLDPAINMPELFEDTFYSKAIGGKRQIFSGGSSVSQTGVSRAGATLPLSNYDEYSKDDLEELWKLESKKYMGRISEKLKITKKE